MATLLLVLICAISVQVVCSALSINPLVEFGESLPFVGKGITLNSLLDFQWHLLVITGLLPAGLVWLRDKHVRVDFFYAKLSTRMKKVVDVIGNLLFALPFFLLIIPSSINFAQRAWSSDEGSRNNGLDNLWLIKSVLPLGMTLLALAIVIEIFLKIRSRGQSDES